MDVLFCKVMFDMNILVYVFYLIVIFRCVGELLNYIYNNELILFFKMFNLYEWIGEINNK